MRTADEWEQLALGSRAALVLGWRKGSTIAAGRLNLARDMQQDLRQRAQASLGHIGSRTVRTYDPAAQLEDDEVFLLTIDQLPTRPKRRSPGRQPKPTPDEPPDEQEEASALVDLLSIPGNLDPIPADDVRGQTFLFYAVVFSDPSGSVAFLKRHNPGSVLKTGRVLGMVGQDITRIEEPVLIFEPDFDLIIDGDELAALKPTALARLFVDLDVAAAAVPSYVAELRTTKLKFSADTLNLLTTVCSRRRLLAGRLQSLIQTNHIASLEIQMVRAYVVGLKEDPSRFIRDGALNVSEDDVAALIDVLDQRHYRGGYDQMLRRADRTSVIT